MAHKVCIGGTAYEIDGGKAMVDGTVYEIDHGVANVDGTAYEVGFAPPVMLTIQRTWQMTDVHHTWFVINGQTYDGGESVAGNNYSSPTYVSVDIGTKVLCCIEANIDTTEHKVNNEIVELTPSADNTYKYYEYTVSTNAILQINEMDNGTLYTGGFRIHEIRNDPAMLTIQKASGKDPYSGNTISADATYAKVTINGAVYDGSSAVELVLPAGTRIECCVKTQKNGIAHVDVVSGGKSTRVAQANTSGASVIYAYTVTGDATILVRRQYFSYESSYFGAITITET